MKAKIAFFLVLTFVSLLTSPLVSHIFDDTNEVTSLIDKSEEKNKGEEFEKDIDIEVKDYLQDFSFEEYKKTSKINNSKSEHYYLELSQNNTPPPELKM